MDVASGVTHWFVKSCYKALSLASCSFKTRCEKGGDDLAVNKDITHWILPWLILFLDSNNDCNLQKWASCFIQYYLKLVIETMKP